MSSLHERMQCLKRVQSQVWRRPAAAVRVSSAATWKGATGPDAAAVGLSMSFPADAALLARVVVTTRRWERRLGRSRAP